MTGLGRQLAQRAITSVLPVTANSTRPACDPRTGHTSFQRGAPSRSDQHNASVSRARWPQNTQPWVSSSWRWPIAMHGADRPS